MKILSIAISKKKGTPKTPIDSGFLKKDYGLEGDAHAGHNTHRQISFLASEEIEKARAGGLAVKFGDFAENFVTQGLDWTDVQIGAKFKLGKDAIVEITQKGKECHNRCAIYYLAGDCIMPHHGVFAKVLEEGQINYGDEILNYEMP